MNMTDTKKLLQEVAAIDKRNLTVEMIAGWQGILSHIPLDIALEAHKLARRDASINYLEPRHIASWAKEAAFQLDKLTPKEETIVDSVPEPICRDHNKRLTSCSICCRRLYEKNHLHDAALLLWAKENIYA